MSELEKGIDGKGNTYFKIGNIRVTRIKKTWDNRPGIRIQAYKNNKDKKLHRGAEFPVPNDDVAYGLIKAIVAALEHKGDECS